MHHCSTALMHHSSKACFALQLPCYNQERVKQHYGRYYVSTSIAGHLPDTEKTHCFPWIGVKRKQGKVCNNLGA